MNNENNNLDSVVLGSLSNDNPVNNQDNAVVTPQNPVNNETVSNTNVVSPTPEVVSPLVNDGHTLNEALNVNPAVNNEPVNNVEAPQPVNPVQNNPAVQNSTAVQNNTAVQNPQPQVAYTSVNSINPSSMPGFDNNIGSNPPISLENEKEPKKKGNKAVFVLVVVILLLLVAIGTYYVLNYTDLLSKKGKITITTNNMVLNVGDELPTNINEYANISGTNSTNCTFNTSLVDTTKEGIYKYTVTCSNNTKEGNITVVDNTELVVLTKTVYHVKGDTVTADEFIEEIKEGMTYSFVDEEKVKNILNDDSGSYTVSIKAVSESGKEATADAKLVVTQNRIKGFIVCSAKEQTFDNYIMEKKIKLAIIEDGNNGFGNIGNEINTFRYNKKEDYQNAKNDNTGSTSITIENITGNPIYDDENLTITIDNELDSTVMYSTYGTDHLKDYSSIRAYFTQTLKYECSYQKVNV